MKRLVAILGLWLALVVLGVTAQTNSIVWHKTADRVDADVHVMSLSSLLEQITAQTGWRVYVEPGTTHNTSAKFKNLQSGEALQRLFGDLNFALLPQTNAAPHLYVFTTKMENATQLVRVPGTAKAKHAPNELLVKLKPGVNPDALAKMYGAKVIGRMDKLGIYRLQFADAAAADAALEQLQNNTDVSDVDYNYYFDSPPTAQALASASIGPLSLQLNPPGGNAGKVIVGWIDTGVQPLGAQLDKFILPEISVADGTPSDNGITHGYATLYTFWKAFQQASSGGSSPQTVSVVIQPVDVYGSSATTTSWYVAEGVLAAVNKGATVLNLSLGSPVDSPILDDVFGQAAAKGILSFGASGNTPSYTPYYPAADPSVVPVTALAGAGQLASYANYWPDANMIALPGTSVVYFGNQPYLIQGTSASAASATGVYIGTLAGYGWSQSQILAAMQKKFAVPTAK